MNLGERQKLYESVTDRILIPNLPVILRLDGRAFHSWCRRAVRPYDERVQRLFDETTKHLVEETNAVVGYTQSDEITLVLYNYAIPDSQIMFNGREAKLLTVVTSIATEKFNSLVEEVWPERKGDAARFDARVFNVPTIEEAANNLLWRELDASRNSVSMAAQSMFSHNELQKKNNSEMQEMMWSQRGVNWNDYPSRFKRGAYFKRVLVERKFTTEELEKLPEKHAARKDPNLLIQRHLITRVELPPMSKIANKAGVIFHGEEPQMYEKPESLAEVE